MMCRIQQTSFRILGFDQLTAREDDLSLMYLKSDTLMIFFVFVARGKFQPSITFVGMDEGTERGSTRAGSSL